MNRIISTCECKSYLILPGVGLRACSLGMDASVFQLMFSGLEDEQLAECMYAEDEGIEASVESSRIVALFFHFISKTCQCFQGTTDQGIGRDSLVEDVLDAHGRPDKIFESIVSDCEEFPGVHEKELCYSRLGISFTFWDGQLACIRTYAKTDQAIAAEHMHAFENGECEICGARLCSPKRTLRAGDLARIWYFEDAIARDRAYHFLTSDSECDGLFTHIERRHRDKPAMYVDWIVFAPYAVLDSGHPISNFEGTGPLDKAGGHCRETEVFKYFVITNDSSELDY